MRQSFHCDTSGLGTFSRGLIALFFSTSAIRAAHPSDAVCASSSAVGGCAQISSRAALSSASNSPTSRCSSRPSSRCSSVNWKRCGSKLRVSAWQIRANQHPEYHAMSAEGVHRENLTLCCRKPIHKFANRPKQIFFFVNSAFLSRPHLPLHLPF